MRAQPFAQEAAARAVREWQCWLLYFFDAACKNFVLDLRHALSQLPRVLQRLVLRRNCSSCYGCRRRLVHLLLLSAWWRERRAVWPPRSCSFDAFNEVCLEALVVN